MNIRIDRNRRYLKTYVNLAQERLDRARVNLRERQLALDEFEKRHRPTFPTTGMRLALERAVRDVKDGYEPTSHLGRDLLDGVSVHGKQGFVSVNHGAPFGRASNGYLWEFTEAEVQRIRDHLKAFGATIVTDWHHERGHGFQLEVSH